MVMPKLAYVIKEDFMRLKIRSISNRITLKELKHIYLEQYKLSNRESSYKVMCSYLSVIDPFLNIKISKLKPIDFKLLFLELKEQSNSSYYSHMKAIRAMFNFAINELQVIMKNPCNVIKEKNQKKKEKYIDNKLYNKILRECALESNRLIIRLLYYTGMRISEVYGLTKQCIHTDYIEVRYQCKNNRLSELKTINSYRKVPIKKKLYDDLLSYYHKKEILEDEMMFRKSSSLYAHLSRYKISPHCFRHTYATNLVHIGVNLKTASELLGNTLQVFINTYVQTSKDENKSVFDLIIKKYK